MYGEPSLTIKFMLVSYFPVWNKIRLFSYFRTHFYPWPFRPRGIVVACVCPSVHPSVRPWTLPCLHGNSPRIWAEITKFVPYMHHRILLSGIENRGQWPWPSRSFWPFDSEFSEIWFVQAISWNRFELESSNLHQVCILRFSWLAWNTGVLDLDLQGNLAISNQDYKKWCSTSLLYTELGRPLKGYYTSQRAVVC